MEKSQINQKIAERLFGYHQVSECIDGKRVSHRDKYGAPYFENDSCFPDFCGNLNEAMEILHKIEHWELTKYTNTSYKLGVRVKNEYIEIISSTIPEAICKMAIKVFNIS